MTGQQRFPISVRVIGIMHRHSSKVKMFMITVLWSDASEVIVYRSFRDFKNFHRQLKKMFPLQNAFRKTDRVIPKFKVRAMKTALWQKGSTKSVRQLRFFDDYCSQLMRCGPAVTQNSVVTQFFISKDDDLQPEFTKNSVIIMPSELPEGSFTAGGSDLFDKDFSKSNISKPFVAQAYRCVADYETKDTKNRPFTVKQDEKVDVLIKDSTGWWLVENEGKCIAWFPAPYLEQYDDDGSDDLREFDRKGAMYCAVKTYSSKRPDEVSVPIGAVLDVLRKSDDGYWLIRYKGKIGYTPSMYLQPYNNPWANIHSLKKRAQSSPLNVQTPSHPISTPFCPETEELNDNHSLHTIYEAKDLQQNCSVQPGCEPRGPPHFRTSSLDTHPLRHHSSQPRHELSRAPRLRAHSLDIVLDSHSHLCPPAMRTLDLANHYRQKSHMYSVSTESSSSSLDLGRFPVFETCSIGYKSPQRFSKGEAFALQPRVIERSSPNFRKYSVSTSSSNIFGSDTLKSKVMSPAVPPRPQTHEILTRCTTMTRKAALETQVRILAGFC